MTSLQHRNHFGEEWVQLWNESSLDNFGSLFAEDAEELSSIASRFFAFSNGRIKGKHTLMDYWTILKSKIPNLTYEFKKSFIHEKKVILFFTINYFDVDAIATMQLNEQSKITQIRISHV